MPAVAEGPKGSRVIAEAFRDADIDTVFTVPGGHFLPTYHEFGRLGNPVIIPARHEQGAGYMASGYALATGRPGVVFSGAPGPGATNLTTAVANAQADSIPLLVISAQVDSRYVHRNVLQHCDNVALFDPFCKRSLQAGSIEEMPSLLATSMQLATSGRPGPVHIAVPQDLQAETAPAQPPTRPVAYLRPGAPAMSDVEQLLKRLADCRRPAILAGHGVIRAGATSLLQVLAEQLGAPVATSRSGIGSISTVHSLSVGMLGFYGTKAAQEAIGEADLVLVLGCGLGEQTTFGWRVNLFASDAQVIQVDVDASQLNLNYGINQGLLSDVGTAIDALVGGLEERKPWYGRKPERHPPQNDPARGISAAKIIHALNAQSPEDALVSADIGNHRLWVCEQLDVTRPEGLLQSCEFDAMGFSLPAAIGASIALPGTKVIAIAGDGGFVHTLGELAVAQELKLPIAAIIFVDGALGILRHQAEEMYGEDHFVRLAPIDFATVAEGFGVEARTVDEDAEVDDAIEWAMKAVEPVLLSITIDPNEIFPPLRTKIEQRQRDLLGEVPA
jgi:acetolactate synthase-1/2/3 large subunit